MEIPKQYEPKEAESRWYPFWEQNNFFAPEQQTNPDAPTFTMVIPPPNVTGFLHMGHALNHTLQDVGLPCGVVAGHRSRRHRYANGRDTPIGRTGH
jgi:valyl-tRNA synthetase